VAGNKRALLRANLGSGRLGTNYSTRDRRNGYEDEWTVECSRTKYKHHSDRQTSEGPLNPPTQVRGLVDP